jgi:hypothetical protein
MMVKIMAKEPREPKIEKGIPLPSYHYYKKQELPYHKLWLKLAPGDSVFYELNGKEDSVERLRGRIQSWRQSFLDRNKNLKWTVTIRQVEGGFRVWRVD